MSAFVLDAVSVGKSPRRRRRGAMAVKLIDKSKKSNIKCEYCGHWTDWPNGKCRLSGLDKHYYNRCKQFLWREDRRYLPEPPKEG